MAGEDVEEEADTPEEEVRGEINCVAATPSPLTLLERSDGDRGDIPVTLFSILNLLILEMALSLAVETEAARGAE
jgi:hypothetical protein